GRRARRGPARDVRRRRSGRGTGGQPTPLAARGGVPGEPVSRPELAILIGLPGAGKTTFFETRLAATHVHVSKDRLKNARDKQARQMALVEDALAGGRSVAVDNQNATARDRAVLIEAAWRHGAAVVGYTLDTEARVCVQRNAGRTGRARVPPVAIFTAA